MGNLGENMGRNNVNVTKCANLQYGNQVKKPKAGTKIKDKGVEGSLKGNQLEHVKLIFSDHY